MTDKNVVDFGKRKAEVDLAKKEWRAIEGTWLRHSDSKEWEEWMVTASLVDGADEFECFREMGFSGHVVMYRPDPDEMGVVLTPDEAEKLGTKLIKAAAIAKHENRRLAEESEPGA